MRHEKNEKSVGGKKKNHLYYLLGNLNEENAVDDVEHVEDRAHARWLDLDRRQTRLRLALYKKVYVLTSVSDPDPDQPGSTAFGRIRIHFNPRSGSRSGSGST